MTAFDQYGLVGQGSGNFSGPGGGTGALTFSAGNFSNVPTNANVNFYNGAGTLIGTGHLHR